jgi:multidrug resistance protein MdtO
MAAIAQTLPESHGGFTWFWEWLRDELAPYPGRIALVARMVAAATVVMIITMTFRVPYGAYGVIFTLILSRESLKATATAVRAVSVGVILAGAYVVLGATLVVGNETLRVLWVIGTFFLAFYVTSALRNYTPAAIRFGYLSVITVPLWDSHISADSKIENTLWAVGALTAASVMMLLLEIAFAALRRTDDLTDAITERLICVQEMLEDYQDGRPVDASPRSHVARLAMVGISRLRQMLWHSTYEAQRAQQLAAVVALVGRLTDIAANLAQFTSGISDDDRLRVARLACSVGEIRVAITSGVVPQITKMSVAIDAPTSLPLLHELEKTVSLIAEVFTHSQSLNTYALPEAEKYSDPAPQFPGMLANTEHIKFGLRGCVAASCCYIIYNVLFWPEIATALTTCFVTALTTIGASHQKQFLRFAGALTGGIGVGIGAQV